MFERRSSRFAVEVLVLVVLAVSVAFAHLNRLVIAGVMLLGWVIVSLLEWVALRTEPHFDAGLPARYYEPEVRLPPPVIVAEAVMRPPSPASATEPAFEPMRTSEPPFEPMRTVEPAIEPTRAVEPIFEEEAVAPYASTTPVSEPEPQPEPTWPVAPVPEPEPVAFVSESVQAAEPAHETSPEEQAVAEIAHRPEDVDQVDFGPELEFLPPAPLEHAVEAAAELGQDSAYEVWPELPASWFDAQRPDESELEEVLEPEPEPFVEPVLETVQEPIGEPLPVVWPELPASWFESRPRDPVPQVEPPEALAPESAESAADEPVAELELPEPAMDLELPGAEASPSAPELARWFSVQPADPLAPLDLETEPDLEPEPEPTVEPELPAWALVDAEAEAEREDELAALESLPDEVERESDVPLGEPLPEESNVTSWFDTQTPALPTSDQEATEPEWLSAPDESELHVRETADTSRGEGPAGSVFAPGPVTEFDLPRSELELDILIGRLAGTQLGEDESLMSWFDAQLPGAVAATEAEPAPEEAREEAPEEAPVRSLYTDDGAVGGWVVGEAREAWSIGEPVAVGRSEVGAGAAAQPPAHDATARHSIDPFAGSVGSNSRSWGRKHAEDEAAGSGSVEAPARPDGRLLLPGPPNRDT